MGYKKKERDTVIQAMWNYIQRDKDFLVDVERESVNQWLKPEDVAYINTYPRDAFFRFFEKAGAG
jgi:hypothetical protein